jgi:hypothetical protein
MGYSAYITPIFTTVIYFQFPLWDTEYDFDYDGCKVLIRVILVGDTPDRANKPEYAIVQVFPYKFPFKVE